MKRQKTNPISGGKRKLETNDEVDATSTKRVQSNPLSHVSSAESGETSNVGLDRATCSPAGVASADLRQDSATAHRLVPGLSDAIFHALDFAFPLQGLIRETIMSVHLKDRARAESWIHRAQLVYT